MKIHRCYVCKKRLWFPGIKVVVKLSDRTEQYWVHAGCLGKGKFPEKEINDG